MTLLLCPDSGIYSLEDYSPNYANMYSQYIYNHMMTSEHFS